MTNQYIIESTLKQFIEDCQYEKTATKNDFETFQKRKTVELLELLAKLPCSVNLGDESLKDITSQIKDISDDLYSLEHDSQGSDLARIADKLEALF